MKVQFDAKGIYGKLEGADKPSQSTTYRGYSKELTIALPPIQNLLCRLSRSGDRYFGNVILKFTPMSSGLNRIKNRMPEKLERALGDAWQPDRYCDGYLEVNGQERIVVREREPYFDIILGKDGAETREFRDFKGFAEDMTYVQKVANAFLKAGIDSAVKLGYLGSNPKQTLILD